MAGLFLLVSYCIFFYSSSYFSNCIFLHSFRIFLSLCSLYSFLISLLEPFLTAFSLFHLRNHLLFTVFRIPLFVSFLTAFSLFLLKNLVLFTVFLFLFLHLFLRFSLGSSFLTIFSWFFFSYGFLLVLLFNHVFFTVFRIPLFAICFFAGKSFSPAAYFPCGAGKNLSKALNTVKVHIGSRLQISKLQILPLLLSFLTYHNSYYNFQTANPITISKP